jgi:hypothetical protein
MEEYSKDFKFTIKDSNGKVLVETIATFGSDDYPFPEDWKDNGMAQKAIFEFKQELLNNFFQVEVSEDLDFTIKEKQNND